MSCGTTYNTIERQQHFGGTRCPHPQGRRLSLQAGLLFYPEDGSSRCLRNVGSSVPKYMVSHSRNSILRYLPNLHTNHAIKIRNVKSNIKCEFSYVCYQQLLSKATVDIVAVHTMKAYTGSATINSS